MESGQLIGPYRLESLIAEGGMGAVWRAHHPTLDRLVAIKFVKSEARDNAHARDAFMREVRNLSRLHGPQIVHVLDFGFTDEGDPYMVTEFLQGEDLLARLRAQGRITVREAVFIGIEVLKALAEAHALNLIHRDLKPGNIFLQRLAGGARMAVKVLDFGVAKLLAVDDAGEATLWPDGSPKGSPRYMAPEQVLCEPVTPAADIYAFGAMLYRAVSGQPVFAGPVHVMLRSHLERSPESLRTRFPGLGVPVELDDIILGCLAKEPADRPASADALQARLERLLQSLAEDAGELVEAGDYGISDVREPGPDKSQIATLSTGEVLPGWLEPSLAPTGSGSLADGGPSQGTPEGSLAAPAAVGDLSRPPTDEAPSSLGGWAESSALEMSPLELAFDPKDSLSGAEAVSSNSRSVTPEPVSPIQLATPAVIQPASARPAARDRAEPDTPPRVRAGHLIGLTVLLLVGVWFFSKGGGPLGIGMSDAEVQRPSRTYDFGRARWALDLGVELDVSVVDSASSTMAIEDAAPARVRVRVVPGPALFREVATGKVVCPQANVCELPINKNIRVEQAGYRWKILSGDDLYDRRNNTWRIILQAR